MASVPSSSSSSSSVVWEWVTDALLWRPFPPVLSKAIEDAFLADQPFLQLCIGDPTPSHSITFDPHPACQRNRSSGRSRPVRRAVDPSGAGEWQWWEEESQQWHAYDPPISAHIESAWEQSQSESTAYYQASAPAGVHVRILHRKYAVEFEAHAEQRSLFTQFTRKVRRRLVPLAAPAPARPPAATMITVPAPSVRAGSVSLAFNAADLEPYAETADDNDCPICVTDLRERNAVRLAKCRHVFCKDCIVRWFQTRPTCPVCTMPYGVITGTQPNGTMIVRRVPAGSPEFGNGLEGFPDVDLIQIHYLFPSGTQGPEHPSPGLLYTGTQRVSYLPSTKEGEDVLNLLKIAWDRRLLFSVGTSITTGRRNVVTWAGVHHKTSTWGGPTNFGYPDPTYFARVKAELAERGVR